MKKRKTAVTLFTLALSASVLAGTLPVYAEDTGFEPVVTEEYYYDGGDGSVEYEPDEGEYYIPDEAEYMPDESEYVPEETEDTSEETKEKKHIDVNWEVYSGEVADDLSEEDRQRFINASSGLYGEIYQPVTLLGTQLVAGINYAYLCRMVPITDYKPVWFIAVVYEDLEGNAKLTSVRDLRLNDLRVMPKGTDASDNDGAYSFAGAWTVPERSSAGDGGGETSGGDAAAPAEQKAVLPEKAAEAFRLASESYNGAALDPVVLLGTDETEGENYLLFCRDKNASSDQKGRLYIAGIHTEKNVNWSEDTEGEEGGEAAPSEETGTLTGEFMDVDILEMESYLYDGPRTFITGNGVLSIELPDFSWKAVEDEKHLAAFSNGTSRMELSHLVNGEQFAPVLIADKSYVAAYQAYYSTPEDVYIATGGVKQKEDLDPVRLAIQSVQVLRYGTDPVEPIPAEPTPTPTPEPTPTPSDPRGERTGWEATVYADHSSDGIAIFEYTNTVWYDAEQRPYVQGDGVEKGYIWYDSTGAPYYLFAYPYELRRTGNAVDVTWDTGLQTTLREFTDGVWRDFRYVAYTYMGDYVWMGEDGSAVTGEAPPTGDVTIEGGSTDEDDVPDDDYDDVPDDEVPDDDGFYEEVPLPIDTDTDEVSEDIEDITVEQE
ncbi:MAG: hypothetical protein IJ123_00210 [Blautia sp.]|nr:hypothetical protein [Blautia sp.]